MLNGLTTVRLKEKEDGWMYQFNYDLLRGTFLQRRMLAYYTQPAAGSL